MVHQQQQQKLYGKLDGKI